MMSDTNSGFWQKIKQQLLFVILYSQSQTPPQSISHSVNLPSGFLFYLFYFFYLTDLSPLQPQRLRLRLFGVLGSFCCSFDKPFLIPADLAQ